MNAKGVSSIVTPFCETDGLFFDNSPEPEGFKEYFEKEIFDYRKDREDGFFLDIREENKENLNEVYRELKSKSSLLNEENKTNKGTYIKYVFNDEEEF